ncbi:MAG TPA: methyltransferase domain-containing protein [Acidimicrobiales bacterium]|nr:methyltransferase domain-containing protein [Acidimicrobiales bacterium]
MGVYGVREADMDIVNVEQAEAWNGHEGDVWTEQADRYDRASRLVWRRFLTSVPVGPTDGILDIGCGTGRSTRDLAVIASEGSVVGADLSAVMLELARARTAGDGLGNVSYVQADVQVHDFGEAVFDLAISSFGAMFFADPVAAFTNISRALRPDGSLALLAWRELESNEWLMELRSALAMGRDLPTPPPDAPTPFSLADPDRVRSRLSDSGFEDIELGPIDEPMDLGRDAEDAMAFVRTMGIVEGLSNGLTEADRAHAMEQVQKMLAAHETADGVLVGAAAWAITAKRSATG